jgi:GNAT superfamily N-acetyltransferase
VGYALVSRFGKINSENDRSDVHLLAALEAKAVDFLVTQDGRLHRRAERAGLGDGVLTVEEALRWLTQTFARLPVSLPYIVERKAYEIKQDHTIFSSLRADYPGFDLWFDKCRRQHRECWVLEIGNEIAALVIRKDENHSEAGTLHLGPKILKICTFKVQDEFQGEKFGELLLKQVLWFAQRNNYDLTYVTVYSKHAFLIDLLNYYGFKSTINKPNGEAVLEKPIIKGELPRPIGNLLDFDRAHYPRFHDASVVRKFCVPIQPDYHRRLFPEIAFGTTLPLFPQESLVLPRGSERTPGNTIRKVYLCRSKITRLRPGDLLFFYMSKDDSYTASQSITTVGIVEQVAEGLSADDLIRHTAKRSVFTAEDLRAMNPSVNSPVKMIDFLLVGHLESPVSLSVLVANNVFSSQPPQSISELSEHKYATFKPYVKLGFVI